MSRIQYILIVALAGFFISCQSSKKVKPIEKNKNLLSKGFQTLSSTCFSCHSPNPTIENKVAPTLSEIKTSYLKLDDFSESLSQFIKDPKVENAHMKEAIQSYGIMPKFDLSVEEINGIISYIYHTPLEKEDWYSNQFKKEKMKYQDLSKLSPIELGKHYAMQTKSTLGKNLKGAIKKKGVDEALSFCNTKAIHLTDSVALSLNVKIKRVSDKNRNPNNQANEDELKYIETSKVLLAKGEKIKPQLIEGLSHYTAYYPIMTNKMCMNCHGKTETEINTSTLSILNELYPNDKATGYKPNELRGIWVVEMDKN